MVIFYSYVKLPEGIFHGSWKFPGHIMATAVQTGRPTAHEELPKPPLMTPAEEDAALLLQIQEPFFSAA